MDNDNYEEKDESKKSNKIKDLSLNLVFNLPKKRMSLKTKLIIAGVSSLIVIMILFMFIIMVIDDEDGGSTSKKTASTSYEKVSSKVNGSNIEELWYPVGSKEVTTKLSIEKETVEFRSGEPVATSLTSDYGERKNSFHHGVDISAPGDVYLIAMADGVISYISENRNSGYNVKPDENLKCSNPNEGLVLLNIKYNNGYESRYLHIKEGSIPSYLNVGSKVYQGQVVAQMGNTGCSTGQHLHYELSLNGEKVNPNNYGISATNSRENKNKKVKSENIFKENFQRILDKIQFLNSDGDNKEKVCLTFKDYGYSDSAVAAIMVNIQHESNFNPNAINELDCVGLVQWCFGRQVNIKSTYSTDWVLINNQLEFIQRELTNNYTNVYNMLLSDESTSEKTYQFCMKYEIPGETYCIQRRDSEKNSEYLNYVMNGCQ